LTVEIIAENYIITKNIPKSKNRTKKSKRCYAHRLVMIVIYVQYQENLQMNFVGRFSKTFWAFYGCFRWVLFYQVGGFLVGLCKGL
jgi:hypothetical protein